jgi:hypothetical protein
VLSISPFLVIDGNTQNETSKLAERLTELIWKLWQTCNTQAPLHLCKIFRNYGFGLPQAHKRDKQVVLHVSWPYASEQKKNVSGIAYVYMVISCKQVFTSKSPSCTLARCIYLPWGSLALYPKKQTWENKVR